MLFRSQKYITACYHSEQSEYSGYKILIVDEIDKAYIKEGSDYVPKMIEELFRKSISNGKIIITASNESEQGLKEIFGESTMSLIKRYLDIVPMEGNDRSESMQERWINSLKNKIDLGTNKNIEKMAFLKGEFDEAKKCY